MPPRRPAITYRPDRVAPPGILEPHGFFQLDIKLPPQLPSLLGIDASSPVGFYLDGDGVVAVTAAGARFAHHPSVLASVLHAAYGAAPDAFARLNASTSGEENIALLIEPGAKPEAYVGTESKLLALFGACAPASRERRLDEPTYPAHLNGYTFNVTQHEMRALLAVAQWVSELQPTPEDPQQAGASRPAPAPLIRLH